MEFLVTKDSLLYNFIEATELSSTDDSISVFHMKLLIKKDILSEQTVHGAKLKHHAHANDYISNSAHTES